MDLKMVQPSRIRAIVFLFLRTFWYLTVGVFTTIWLNILWNTIIGNLTKLGRIKVGNEEQLLDYTDNAMIKSLK